MRKFLDKNNWLREVFKNTGVQVLGKMAGIGISLLVTRILTRKLGVADYGVFLLIQSVLILLGAGADAGTTIVGVRELVQSRDFKRERADLFGLRFLTTSLAFFISLLVLCWYRPLIPYRGAGFLAFAMIWGTMLAGNWEILAQVKRQFEYKVMGEILFAGGFLGLVWGKKELSLAWVFGIYLLIRGLSLAIVALFKREWLEGISFKSSFERMGRLWKKCWPMGLYLFIFTSYDKAVDSLMIRNFLGAREVGWYGLSYKVYNSLVLGAYFFVSSVYPLLAAGKKREQILKWGRVLLLTTGGIAAVVLWFAAAPAIQWLGGREFWPAIKVLQILGVALVFSYLNHLSGFNLVAKGGQKKLLSLGTVALIFNVMGNIFVIPRWGINGAAWITAGTEGLMFFLYGLVIKK